MPPDPIADAHALLVLARLMYRQRATVARHGVVDGAALVRAVVPLGRRLREAVEEAERAADGSDERRVALERVAQIGVELWTLVDDRREGIQGLIGEALRGVRGEKDFRPQAPRRLGWP